MRHSETGIPAVEGLPVRGGQCVTCTLAQTRSGDVGPPAGHVRGEGQMAMNARSGGFKVEGCGGAAVTAVHGGLQPLEYSV